MFLSLHNTGTTLFGFLYLYIYALSRNDMFCCCSVKNKHLDTALSPPRSSRDMSNNCWTANIVSFYAQSVLL